ncbi:MAG: DUF3990 domain-containing protein [Peptococcaceae bacterium]|jgi:hypothetical protein|nr:DUF3990 domain-containing protein [Peptococcaceae bacterium]
MQVVYHGTDNPDFVPVYNGSGAYNDYGSGLYCTEDIELAREWACKFQDKKTGYVFSYGAVLDGLNVLRLASSEYTVLNWLALIIKHRMSSNWSALVKGRAQQFVERFAPDTGLYDVIIGYRANDSYFAFAQEFLNVALTVGQLSRAFDLGRLGLQIMLKSERAFLPEYLKPMGSETIDAHNYDGYNRTYIKRDALARETLNEVRQNLYGDGRTILDMLEGVGGGPEA